MKNNYFSICPQSRSTSALKQPPCRFCKNKQKRDFIHHLLESSLSTKHRASQNFYYIREINDICFQRISMYKVRFGENKILDSDSQNLKRFYYKFEIRNKLQQIMAFNTANYIEHKPKIYLPEFNEIMFVHSLKKLQQIELKKKQTKMNKNSKNTQNPSQINKNQQFNVLENLNFSLQSESSETKLKVDEIENQSQSEGFSIFLKERSFKLNISRIKKQEEISDLSLYKISQFLTLQKQDTFEKVHKKSARNPLSSRQISSKYQKSPLLINPALIKNKTNTLTNNKTKKKTILTQKKEVPNFKKTLQIHELPSSFPFVITHLAINEHYTPLSEREPRGERTPRKIVKSNNPSPNTAYNRFFLPDKYKSVMGKTKENFQKHKNMRSNGGSENNDQKKIQKNQEFDEYMMLTERKKNEDDYEKRLGKSMIFF